MSVRVESWFASIVREHGSDKPFNILPWSEAAEQAEAESTHGVGLASWRVESVLLFPTPLKDGSSHRVAVVGRTVLGNARFVCRFKVSGKQLSDPDFSVGKMRKDFIRRSRPPSEPPEA